MTKRIIALVGMAGAGKSDVAHFLASNGLPVVRFGEETDRWLREKGLPSTEENERMYRVRLRKEMGMAAYAMVAKPKIDEVLLTHEVVILDGLYSWEEYKYLKEQYPELMVIGVFADRSVRYARLERRSTRSLVREEAEKRDIAEIEDVQKGGPLAMADYILENNGTPDELRQKTKALLQRLDLPAGRQV